MLAEQPRRPFPGREPESAAQRAGSRASVVLCRGPWQRHRVQSAAEAPGLATSEGPPPPPLSPFVTCVAGRGVFFLACRPSVPTTVRNRNLEGCGAESQPEQPGTTRPCMGPSRTAGRGRGGTSPETVPGSVGWAAVTKRPQHRGSIFFSVETALRLPGTFFVALEPGAPGAPRPPAKSSPGLVLPTHSTGLSADVPSARINRTDSFAARKAGQHSLNLARSEHS